MSGQLPKMLPAYGGQRSDCISRASRTFTGRGTGDLHHTRPKTTPASRAACLDSSCCGESGAPPTKAQEVTIAPLSPPQLRDGLWGRGTRLPYRASFGLDTKSGQRNCFLRATCADLLGRVLAWSCCRLSGWRWCPRFVLLVGAAVGLSR